MASSPELVITAAGAWTAVGPTLVASAAAVRAGVVRARPLPHWRVASADGGEVPVTGRPVHGRTEGFAQFGRWCRLALGGLADAFPDGLPRAPEFWQRTQLAICLPVLDADRFALPGGDPAALVQHGFHSPFLALAGLPQQQQHAVAFGHRAAALALQGAAARLQADHRLQRLLLVAADSYVDAQSLEWLQQGGRLRTDGNPDGLIPGEAGAALLVERADAASERRAPTLARLPLASAHSLPGSADDSPTRAGVRIAKAVEHALTGSPARAAVDAYVDLNGESARSAAWGSALVALQARGTAERLRLHYPATSLGETGAAAAVVAAGLAIRTFSRDRGATGGAVICSLGDGANAAAFLLRPP